MLHNLTTRIFSLIVSLSSGQQNFVLSNPLSLDNPIIYTSEGFHKLIGYTRKQVRRLGRNCRFLEGISKSSFTCTLSNLSTNTRAIVTVFPIFSIDSIGWDPLAPRNRNPLDLLLFSNLSIHRCCTLFSCADEPYRTDHPQSSSLPTVLACTFSLSIPVSPVDRINWNLVVMKT